MNVEIKLVEGGKLPEYQTSGSSGMDCYARLDKEIIIHSRNFETIPLGFCVAIPRDYELQIRPRSGLARKNGIKATLGTIDSDYRGEVGVILFNDSEEDFIVKNDDRICQAVLAPVFKVNWEVVDQLDKTERGDGGFGHTGV